MAIDLLQKLINAHGISGKEMDVRGIISSEIKKYVDTVRVDKVGNLIAHKKGKGPTVMFVAHMDEVGLIVSKIEDDTYGKSEDGKIYFRPIGGVEPFTLITQKVAIDGKVAGVITTKEMSEGAAIESVPTIDDVYVDTGLTKKELEKKGIEIGSYISFEDCGYCTLGSSNVISGKAIDDRAGCYMLLELAKRLKRYKTNIYYVFTVQEELGLHGAKISTYEVDPDWAIVVDVTDSNGKTMRTGEGPYITIKDADMIGNHCINGWLKDVAKKNKIPLQLSVSEFGTTDALKISFSKGGIPTSVVGISVKNLHTSIGMADVRDINNCIRLLELLHKSPPNKCIV